MRRLIVIALAILLLARGATGQQIEVEPEIRAVVERFFAAQQAEDAVAYLALWSAKAQKPPAAQLQFVFASGDDTFRDIVIQQVLDIAGLRRVRVSVFRERTSAQGTPDGRPVMSGSVRQWSLTLVREGGEWKVLSEGTPADDLASALMAAGPVADREALLAGEPELVNDRLLQALSRRADALAQAREYAGARGVYERVLEIARRIGNRKAEGEAIQNVANTHYYERNLTAALRAYDERAALEREQRHDPGLAAAMLGVATIKYSQFEYGEALVAYREALRIFDRVSDESSAATALLSTGNVLYVQGDFDGATIDYRRSRDLYRKTHHTEGEARALQGLGRAYTAQGDYDAALEAFAGVREEGRARGNRATQGNALQAMGEVHLRLGNVNTARTSFDDARRQFEGRDPAATGRAWQGMALADLSAARFAPAAEAYANSIAACTSAQDDDCVARAIVGLAYAQSSQGKFSEAIRTYQKGIAAFTALNKPEEIARAEVGLAQAFFGNEEFTASLAAAGSAAGRAQVNDVIWRARESEARALRRLNQPARALAAAADAVAIVQRLMAAALERPSARVAPDTASAYALLAVLHAETGDAAAALATVEQRRAHALRIALATNERDIVRDMSLEERAAERDAATRVGSLLAQVERHKGLPKPDKVRIAELEAQLTAASADRAALQKRMFERRPELRVWRGLAQPASVEEIGPLVEEGVAVLELVIDEHDLLIVTGARRDTAVQYAAFVTRVTRQVLAERVAAATAPAALGNVIEWRAAAAPLLALLPAAVLDTIVSARRVIVVPDDVLWRVPFEALPVQNGFVADRTEIGYAGSLTALVRAKEAANGSAPPATGPRGPLVGVAAPQVSSARRDRVSRTAPDWRLRDENSALSEAQRLAAANKDTGAVMLTGSGATEGALRAALPGAASVHIAAPTRVNGANALFSRVLLAEPALMSGEPRQGKPVQGGDEDEDGVLEAREVMNLALQAHVAVLSDGSAIAMRDAAAALGTLQWAWRAAGVQSVVVSRWAGEDPAAETLLLEFHSGVREGRTPAAAIHAAQAAVRKREGSSAPWFWARWMAIGR